MSREIASKERVEQAANGYLLEGCQLHEVSSCMVYEKIGGGSYTTIGHHLKAWKEERLKAAAGQYPVPPELSDIVDDYAKRTWMLAYDEAFKQFSAQIETMMQQTLEFERLQRVIEAADAKQQATMAELEANQRRFIAFNDALRQQFNCECGGLLEVLKANGATPVVLERFAALQVTTNAYLDAAHADQAEVLSRYLHTCRLGHPETESSTEAGTVPVAATATVTLQEMADLA